MDLLTQGVLGAALAATLAPSRQRRLAAGIGLVAGLVPDLDTLIQSGDDPLLVLDFHRHFTHALAFVPIGALLAAVVMWPFLRHRIRFGGLYGYSLAGYALSGVLDACTSYGTHLWLPFSERKEAWNLIAVVDPVFTLLLAVPLWLTWRRPASGAVRIGLVLAACYLGIGYLQQQRVESLVQAVALERGHAPERLVVKPTLGNLVLWRSLYVHQGHIHADAVHAGLVLRHYPGETRPLLGSPPETERAAMIERFRRFADGMLVNAADGLVGDARYAMLPNRVEPIWGLQWEADGRVRFVTRRNMSGAERRQWLDMLLGRPL